MKSRLKLFALFTLLALVMGLSGINPAFAHGRVHGDGSAATAAPDAVQPAFTSNALVSALVDAGSTSYITGSEFIHQGRSDSTAVFTAPRTFFPTSGPSYIGISNGTAADMLNPNVDPDTDLGDNDYRGVNDVTVLRIGLNITGSADCVQFDVQEFSKEYPEYVGDIYNDAFVAELDVDDWEVTNVTDIYAPHNFALAPGNLMFSINSGLTWDPNYAVGTPFSPNYGGTNLYTVSTPITSGTHDLFLTVWEMGDNLYDTAVFLDNLHIFDSGETCQSGVIYTPDNTPPSLFLPNTIIVPQDLPGGAYVTFDPYAIDDRFPRNPVVDCNWNSGDIFPLGQTEVTCTATDDAENTAKGSFFVLVLPAQTNILVKPDFGSAVSFPKPWALSGFRPPYGGAIDCLNFLSGPCSLRFNASDRNIALTALQRVNVPGGQAGDMYGFGIYSRAYGIPGGPVSNNTIGLPSGGGAYSVSIMFFNGARKVATYVVNLTPGTHDFELGSAYVNAPTNYTRIDFRFSFQKTEGTAWFDDAFLFRMEN
jgi:hypothetical protein